MPNDPVEGSALREELRDELRECVEEFKDAVSALQGAMIRLEQTLISYQRISKRIDIYTQRKNFPAYRIGETK